MVALALSTSAGSVVTVHAATEPDATRTPGTSAVVDTSRPRAPAPTRRKIDVAIVRVVLSEQRAYVYDKRRRLVATMPVSTGVEGSTPTGRFRVFSKSRSTFYRADPRQRMRWMTRFTIGRGGDNIGFHSIPYVVTGKSTRRIPTPIGREPSSSGCVRMRTRDAQWIYDNVRMGTRVIVEEYLPGTAPADTGATAPASPGAT
jgi:lipoprotein-anchoring transpeptidase ErfK/SrfK